MDSGLLLSLKKALPARENNREMFAALRCSELVEVKLSSATDDWRHVISINNSTLTDLIRNREGLTNAQLNRRLAKEEVFPAYCILQGGSTVVLERPFAEIMKENITQMIQQARSVAIMGGLNPLQVDIAFYAALGKVGAAASEDGQQGDDNNKESGLTSMLDGAVENGCPMS